MDRKTIVKYGIVRYVPDYLANEVINVGIVFHLIDGQHSGLKFHLIDENAAKIKSLIYNKVGTKEYKSYKERFEYYLNQMTSTIFNSIGDSSYVSVFEENLLEGIQEKMRSEKFYMTGIETALTANVDVLFKTIYETYIGAQYYPDTEEKMAIKRYVHKVFLDKDFINKKVICNYDFYPIKKLKNLKYRVDFKFNDSINNYMLTAPGTENRTDVNEWFAKTNLMFDNLGNDSNIYLLYNDEISKKRDATMEYLDFLTNKKDNVIQLNVDNKIDLDALCDKIDANAVNLTETA